ncbi:hypothetical protein QYF36_014719 [Acer negundo]|nr:hypothetical protein QYF36_014719 [Acer negundo]
MDSANPKKGYVYLKCKLCNEVITGKVKRLKEHLGRTHKNVTPCPKVPKEAKEVKGEMIAYLKNFEQEKHQEVGDEELNLEVDEMANEIRGSLQLIDEGEDDFGDEDNKIRFDDVDGFEDGLNNYEYDLPNDPNPNSVDENND